jgi:hypothetical protein
MQTARGTLIFLSMLLNLLCLNAVAAPKSPHPAEKLDARQRQALTSSLVDMLEKDPLLPGPTVIVSGLERSTMNTGAAGSVWLVPLQIRYQSVSNRYCRLATTDPTLGATAIVPLPPQALHDTCMRVNAQFVVDMNGDGQADVVQSIQIKSNRGNFSLTEAVVYLSTQDSRAYCYSAIASGLLTPSDLRSASAIAAAVSRSKENPNQQKLTCE